MLFALRRMFAQWWIYTRRGNIRSLLALANYKTKTYRCPTCLPRCKNTRVNTNYGFWECLATRRMFLHALSLSARPFATNNDVTTPSDKASRISHHKYSGKSEQKIKEDQQSPIDCHDLQARYSQRANELAATITV